MAEHPLFLSDEGLSSSVHVHPVVYFSILDHFTRRNDNQKRVIGTLLGSVGEHGVIEVRNSFPVPHNETANEVAIDMEFHNNMFELYQKVNPKEVIVGWYATGTEITEYSVLIHDFYASETRTFDPVHLLVDTNLTNDQMSIRAFSSSPLGIPEKTAGTIFVPVKCEVKYHEAERIGVNLLQKARDVPNGTSNLLSDLDHLELAVNKTLDLLAIVEHYVERVLDGKIAGDSDVGRFILDTVAAVPKMETAQFERLFNSNLQDLLMVTYLANLTRTQLALAERLNNVL